MRVPVAIVLIVAAACLMAWGGFVLARGMPGECGGDAPPCPPGSMSAVLGVTASVFALLPLGIALGASRFPEIAPAAVALAAAGAAAGVFSSRFVADPITDATSATWWATGVLGGIAVVAAAIAVLAFLLLDRDDSS
ncbi:hypothetical protein [Conexibacter arvalis]|uniref:Transmembrane protein n=1 Tax=Conexibacter arvalis TaxID=912552 RepID=A0A840IE24_9ACTN|nr:hypothetical protein [Conexibacter arvalis]MBB4663089.1 hypothetical protein [Conexibacter arvalis]